MEYNTELFKKYFESLSANYNSINGSVEKKFALLNSKQREIESLFENKSSYLEKLIEEISLGLKRNYESLINIIDNKCNDFSHSIEECKQNVQESLHKIQNLKEQVEKLRIETTTLSTKMHDITQTDNCGGIDNCEEGFYYAFQEAFRGSERIIAERQQQYIHIVQRAYENCRAPLLDIGAGRGEFLSLCRDAGIEACGIDMNSAMVEHCKGIGLSVVHGEGLSYLRTLPDESLSAVTGFQVIEHLSSNQLLELIRTSFDKLKQGGVVVFETINPDCIDAFKNFFVDMTHTRPVYSSVLKFMFELVGFKDIEVILTSPFDNEMKLVGNDRNTEMLNSYLFGYRDYAIVGWKL